MSTQPRFANRWQPLWERIQQFGSLLIVAAIALFGFWGGHYFLPGGEHAEEAEHSAEESALADSPAAETVTLTSSKFDVAGIEVQPAESGKFQQHLVVPGKLVYDQTQKVDIRATVDSVVKRRLVTLADPVESGQSLLVVTGPEVGAVRNAIDQTDARLKIAEKELAWTNDTHANLQDLIKFLNQDPAPDSEQIKEAFSGKRLGEHGEQILAAFSEFVLAKKLTQRTDRLKSQGAISGTLADERRSALDVAAAKYYAVSEELQFQAQQAVRKAEAEVDAERKQLAVQQQELTALLGPHGQEADTATGVADFVIRSPLGGVVVELAAVESGRFEAGEVLVSIADTSELWVEAQISQQDWSLVHLDESQELTVTLPSLGDQSVPARLRHMGTSVSSDTMAIPLVASVGNQAGRLRPGMAAWVRIPTGESRDSILIPESALQRNGEATFVFVPVGEPGSKTFERRDIEIGPNDGRMIEVVSGLSAGQPVVVSGAFFLKSELLLAEEE